MILLNALAIGIVLSVTLWETLAISTGGLIVPGYLALALERPLGVALTLAVAALAHCLVRLFSNLSLLYGRRRRALALLLGFFLGWAASWLASPYPYDSQVAVIGYLLPGLIADWMDRVGIARTLAGTVLGACSVRLLLMILGIL